MLCGSSFPNVTSDTFVTSGPNVTLQKGTYITNESLNYSNNSELPIRHAGVNFLNGNIKILTINITNLTEEQKDKLRGALKFFTGDRNNTKVSIINGENNLPAGGIFLNDGTFEELKEIVGEENIM